MSDKAIELRTASSAEPMAPFYGAEPIQEATVPLSHYLWTFRRHRWKIVMFVTACVLATLLTSMRLTPIYESVATIDIDRQMPAGVVGEDANRSTVNDADQFLATQIKLIQSDSVLRPVADRFKLFKTEKDLESSRPRNPDAPVRLKHLKVTRPPNTYLLLVSYQSANPKLAADVSNAVARSYLEHTYEIRYRSSADLSVFMEKQQEELRAKMERSGEALARFERELNVINPEEKTSILSARLLQLNTEYTNAQADRVRKQTTYQEVHTGSLPAAQVSTQADSLHKLSEHLEDAQQKFSDIQTHFGTQHPEYKRAAAQVAELEKMVARARENIAQRVEVEYREALNRENVLLKTVAETKAEFDNLNARSFEYQALKQEADADKKLYEELVRKIREAGINSSFQNSSIRIADSARPGENPVFPKIKLNLLLAFLLSTVLAGGAAVLHDTLDKSVRDPDQLSRMIGAEVISSLPAVRGGKGLLPAMKNTSTAIVRIAGRGEVEAATNPFQEAVQTLRNSILLADFDHRLRSLLFTSASPGEGKSTIAANVAAAHASQGRKTLLIDCDLRRPSLHRKFEIQSSPGLSDVLLSNELWQNCVVKIEGIPDLHILPSGPPSKRAGDLIGRGLLTLMDEVSPEYDLVILDSPPLLGFPEPLQMATVVDGVVVVARAGETNKKAVAAVVNTLKRLRAHLVGVVLNQVNKDMSESYYYYGYYGKYYRDRQSA